LARADAWGVKIILGVNFAQAPSLSLQQRTGFHGKEVTMPHIRAERQPVTQITVVEADPGKQAEALELMTKRAAFMARQPGFVSISLHRSLDGRRIVNYVQWESRDLLAAAHRAPEFRKAWGHFDHLADEIDPHLYEVAHVVGRK
jgi:heme-degrading monooxygenase HmoA